MIKQIVAILLIFILIGNFFGFLMGKISTSVFWVILVIGIAITYIFYPKEEAKKTKKRN